MMPKLRPISLAAMLLLSGVTLAVSAQEARRPYIIQLQDQPAAAYTGGVAGLPATQPKPGVVFDYNTSDVQDYVRYLDTKRESVKATVANAPILANYDVVLNGFAAMLTDAEVLKLKANSAVADVQADVARHVDTVSTADFLKLTAAGGLYSQFAGGSLVKGEDMVVGIVDGGIWPENPAFADRVDANGKPTFDPSGTLAYTSAPAFFKGGCVAGEGFDPVKHCNNKLIGAKYFNATFLSQKLPKNWTEFYSPRDSGNGFDGVSSGHGGHGDHTASTAAGNAGVAVTINGIPMGEATGMAPRARIASYKVCWTYDDKTNPDGSNSRNTCYNSDAIAAIDEAVKDGVNVLNYSISGSQTSSADAVEQAFYRASLANVFVAASAGNSGPANAVAHISPWVTTVAASTHDRNFAANVILGNGGSYSGASTNTTNVSSKILIRAEDAALGTGDASFCYSGTPAAGAAKLDPAKVAGKIVVCTRGDNARVDKSLAVLNAGGVGMILVDRDVDTGPVGDIHSVPSVHLNFANGALVKAYAATAGATASITAFSNQPKPAPVMAGFSSRGPNQGDFNILKPDLTAPGVDVIASVTPNLTVAERNGVADGSFVPPEAYASYQGTSMSSPHVAGLALLLRQLRPSWSPAAIKSALMTTAYSTINDGVAGASNGLLPWSQGSGHVDPNKAANPGLVYDAGKADYLAYQCKVNKSSVTPASDCTAANTLDETYNLNLPSITAGQIGQSVTIRRTVTNVSGAQATFNATASVPGFTTSVTPSSLTIPAGGKASFTVKLTPTTALTNTWYFGQLVWSDGSTTVRSPIQARTALSITSPAELTSDKTSGSKLFVVKTLFSGLMTATKGGLKDVTMSPAATLAPTPANSAALRTACGNGTLSESVKTYNVTVPAGTIVARFALRQQDTTGAGQDHDLGVQTPSGGWLYSGADNTNEVVQIASPAAGTYRVCVLAWGGADVMSHKLSQWVVTPSDTGGNLTVAIPGKVVANANTTVGMSWSGLQAGKRYVGGAQFRDLSGNIQATTVLRVDTGSASVPSADQDAKQTNVKK